MNEIHDELGGKIIMKHVSKKFEKYVGELMEGKHKGTLCFRNEMRDVLFSLKSGEQHGTISKDVHDACEKFGLEIKEVGIGWIIKTPSRNKSADISR